MEKLHIGDQVVIINGRHCGRKTRIIGTSNGGYATHGIAGVIKREDLKLANRN